MSLVPAEVGRSIRNAVVSKALMERKQNDEKGERPAIVRHMRWLAGRIIVPVLKDYENSIIFTILFTLQESR